MFFVAQLQQMLAQLRKLSIGQLSAGQVSASSEVSLCLFGTAWRSVRDAACAVPLRLVQPGRGEVLASSEASVTVGTVSPGQGSRPERPLAV